MFNNLCDHYTYDMDLKVLYVIILTKSDLINSTYLLLKAGK